MQIEELSQGKTFVHRLDPRVKIITTVFFSVVAATCQTVAAAAAILVFPIVLILAAGISLRLALTRLLVVNTFVLALWFIVPLTSSGEILFTLGPLDFHRQGIVKCVVITLKSNAIVLTIMGLLGTSSIFSLVHALGHMGVPDKLVHLFFFCFRYVHVIHAEYHRLATAMKIRGFRPRTNVHTYRAYAYLVGMLLVRSFDRAERIVSAMKCRGFRGQFYIIHHYEMKGQDYLLAASSAILTAFVLVSR